MPFALERCSSPNETNNFDRTKLVWGCQERRQILKSFQHSLASRSPVLIPILFFTATLALASGGETKSPTEVQPQRVSFEATPFETQDGRTVEAEVGTFTVVENRRERKERTIELAMVRFKSTNPKPGFPIVYLAGGPGGSGTGTARGSRFDLFLSMRQVADVIAFDQRGTGSSHTLPKCSRAWDSPMDKPVTRAEMEASFREVTRFCAQEWRTNGVDLDAYNSEESADDLEDLRRALGVEKLNLWSISYGSHLAMAALRRHPDSFHRVILAGPEGPDHTVKLPSDSQRLLEEINARIRQKEDLRELFPDFLGDVARVLERLEKQPAKIPLPEGKEMVIGKFDVQMLAAGALGSPEYQAFLPLAFQAMAAGNFGPVAEYLVANRRGEVRAMGAAMDAASGISKEREKRVRKEARATLLSDAINFPWEAMREGIGVRDLGTTFRGPLITEVPTLFITGSLDGRTPVGNALDLLPGFRNGIHLEIEGAGHSDPLFLSHPKIEKTLVAFLQGKPVAKHLQLTVDVAPMMVPPTSPEGGS